MPLTLEKTSGRESVIDWRRQAAGRGAGRQKNSLRKINRVSQANRESREWGGAWCYGANPTGSDAGKGLVTIATLPVRSGMAAKEKLGRRPPSLGFEPLGQINSNRSTTSNKPLLRS